MNVIADLFPWFDVTAFNFGVAVILAWWFIGVTVGWLFDLIRKS
ncbi:hypothetical protein [Desulfomicrobium orale]|mgnify:CR=1 FL=1|nr:hypothetical protein [Desulfomicrobium orale]